MRATLAAHVASLGAAHASFPPAAADQLLQLAAAGRIDDGEKAAAALRATAVAMQAQQQRAAPPGSPRTAAPPASPRTAAPPGSPRSSSSSSFAPESSSARLAADVLPELRRAAAAVSERVALAALHVALQSAPPETRALADAAMLTTALVGPQQSDAVAAPLRACEALRTLRLADALGADTGRGSSLGAAVAELADCSPPPWTPLGSEAPWAEELRAVRARHAASSASAGLVAALAQVRQGARGERGRALIMPCHTASLPSTILRLAGPSGGDPRSPRHGWHPRRAAAAGMRGSEGGREAHARC